MSTNKHSDDGEQLNTPIVSSVAKAIKFNKKSKAKAKEEPDADNKW